MKKLVIAAMVAAFVMSSSMVMARQTCTIDSVDGNKVTMTCAKADKLKAGDKVKVKAGGKKAYEGC